MMSKDLRVPPLRRNEDTEELVGVLTAISVVSKRLAKKLTLLERYSAEGKEGDKRSGHRQSAAFPAD
ncbi:hypothetical protein FACS1894132_08270 [Clostridia bacterium]|nr:hypothetical protein FACS1894132_08270 [Clostridia bacterium]